MFIFPFDQLAYYQQWAFRERFFTAEECDRIATLSAAFPTRDVVLRAEEAIAPGVDVRKSRVATLPLVREAEWIYQRLGAAVLECNKALYNFQLNGFIEPFQFDQYPVGGLFDWHQEFGPRETSNRKLGFIVQLSESEQYAGGDVEFFAGRGPQKSPRTRGTVILAPTFIPMRITLVTSGARNSLVGWASGPPFR